jgi:hypothetical protein
MQYSLPIKPSPNLPNDKSINLYPSLCFFEGTNVSVGRGTENNFKFMAHPICHKVISVVPKPIWEHKPSAQGSLFDLSNEHRLRQLQLKWLIKTYERQQTKRSSSILFYKTGRNTKTPTTKEEESQKLTLERAGKPV